MMVARVFHAEVVGLQWNELLGSNLFHAYDGIQFPVQLERKCT